MTCSDPRSRSYLRESVQCYKAGAYRASVVACWIAVAFDLVDKIRELAASDDKEAQSQISDFERIQRDNDISGALRFEKELPSVALNKFEFISHLEYLDLVRLVEDRNRCAHPSQVSDDKVFEASAELARLHISNSVRSILSQPAAQGKAALERIMRDMESRYFPSKEKDVYGFLCAGPLAKPRKALYKNFIQILVKTLTSHKMKGQKHTRARHALRAVKKMHPALWEDVFAETFNRAMASVESDEDFASATVFIAWPQGVGAWEVLLEVQKLRVVAYVENIPAEHVDILDDLFDVSAEHDLYKSAVRRIRKSSLKELRQITWMFIMPTEAFERLLYLYSKSSDFAEANDVGRFVRSSIPSLLDAKPFLAKVIKLAVDNFQIESSNELIGVLRAFANEKPIGIDHVRESVAKAGLKVGGL